MRKYPSEPVPEAPTAPSGRRDANGDVIKEVVMTENNHHDSAALDKLTEPFTVLPNDNPASDAKRQELIDKPAFGQVFSDNMAHMSWTKGEGWGDRRIEPYAPLKLDPGASVLHFLERKVERRNAFYEM